MGRRSMSRDGTALVTGGAGFIGSAIARALVAEGREVRVFDNFLTGFEENLPAGALLVRGDLRDLDVVREACRGVDVVFHQGAVRSVPRSIDEPVLVEQCNAAGNSWRGIAGAGCRVCVPIGAARITAGRAAELRAITARFAAVVGRVKGLSTVSLRYFNVFGPGQHPESKYAAVFPAFIKALVEGTPPEVHWDGEQSRDFSYIDDVVRANLAAAAAGERADGTVMNVGGGRPKTVNEVLRAVSDAIGTWIDPVSTPKRAGDVRHTRADITRARELLDWEPEADWNDAVEATVRWFQEASPDRRAG